MRQLIKVESVTLIYGLFLWVLWTPSHLPGLGMNTQFQRFSFPDSGNNACRISKVTLLQYQHVVSQTRLRTAELVGETCLPPPSCLCLLSILPNTTTNGISGHLVCFDLVYEVMGERKEKFSLRICNHSPAHIRAGNLDIYHV